MSALTPRKSPKKKPDDPDQSRRFIMTAIERGADRLSSPADKLLGRLAKMPPEPRTKRVVGMVDRQGR
jgi:hypothetical protein